MPKAIKLAACEPCRLSKLACDHLRPICSRCRKKKLEGQCTYRPRPFKKLVRPSSVSLNSAAREFTERSEYLPGERAAGPGQATPIEGLPVNQHTYPNPGYLGSSSHITLFGHLSTGDDKEANDSFPFPATPDRRSSEKRVVNEALVSQGAELIEQLCRFSQIPACVKLVKAWVATGANLALGGLFTEKSALTAQFLLASSSKNLVNATEISRNLFTQSCRPLDLDTSTTFDSFCSQFSQKNARWETLGFFFTTVSRATLRTAYDDPPYKSDEQKRNLRKLAMHYSDRCLELALSLDCLNDLQLILQYENFILHSHVDGDQSFQSWRKLGDVASSLFALGYHQEMGCDSPIPPFLQGLRQAVFARTYSTDKNVSIFLGRPPRIHRKYCQFHFPRVDEASTLAIQYFSQEWEPHEQFDFSADTRWSALCAVLKEDILGLSEAPTLEDRLRRGSLIQAKAEAQWEALPEHFRLQGTLKSYDRPGVELDFMVGARLSQLHVLLLLRITLVSSISEPDEALVNISADLLNVVSEAIMLKSRLVDSGTSLIWKVAYYGLAAAGVSCLFLLSQGSRAENRIVEKSRIIRNLSVIVAEVEMGTLVHVEDANYAVLAGAAHTIKSLLDRLLAGKSVCLPAHLPNLSSQAATATADDVWNPWGNNNPQDFEVDFWTTLADHPFLAGGEAEMVTLPEL